MSWYWIVLILIAAAYAYIWIGARVTALLMDAEMEYSYLQDAFWGLVWPITLFLIFEICLAFKINQKHERD